MVFGRESKVQGKYQFVCYFQVGEIRLCLVVDEKELVEKERLKMGWEGGIVSGVNEIQSIGRRFLDKKIVIFFIVIVEKEKEWIQIKVNLQVWQ